MAARLQRAGAVNPVTIGTIRPELRGNVADMLQIGNVRLGAT